MPLADPTPGATTWVTRLARPAAEECYRKTVTFAADQGDLAPGTPVYQSAGQWLLWTAGQKIHGFVISTEVATDATNAVQGLVLLRGLIRYGSIVLPDGEDAAVLKAVLRRDMRELGLDIQDLDAGDLPSFDNLGPNLPFVASGAVVYDLAVTLKITAPFVSSGEVVYDLTVTQ